MLRNFLFKRSATWGPALQGWFEHRGITVEGVTESGAVLHYNGEAGLLGAVKSLFWLGALDTTVTLAAGIGIGYLIFHR